MLTEKLHVDSINEVVDNATTYDEIASLRESLAARADEEGHIEVVDDNGEVSIIPVRGVGRVALSKIQAERPPIEIAPASGSWLDTENK